MGIGKNGFYTLDDIDKYKAKIKWIYSNRNDGKSYAVKMKCLQESFKEKKPLFALIRRNAIDIKPSKIERYFIEREEKNNVIKIASNGEYDHVICKNNYIFPAKYIEDKEEKAKFAIGEYYDIATSCHEKSTGHICKYIIAEEMLTDGVYLRDEPDKFMQLVSTLVRSDNDVTIYMLGNNINRFCPYFKEWGMEGVFRQKIGTIEVYHYKQIDGSIVDIACEFAPQRKNKKSSLFIGKSEKSIQGGEWLTFEYPKLYKEFGEFELIDMITYSSTYGEKYTIALIYDDETNGKYCYVYPAKHICDRVLTTEFSKNPYHTPCLNINRGLDKWVHDCYINNKFMYSDNLTGTDFNNALKSEKKNPLL